MNNINIDLRAIGDILAVPFFATAIYYFLQKNRTLIENIVLFFVINGFIFDLISSYYYLKYNI